MTTRNPVRPVSNVRQPHELLIAAGLSVSPMVTIGFARFAYGLLLPSMRSDLHWSYTQAGAMNTANSVGYLLGALLSTPLISWAGPRRAFRVGLVITCAAIPACAGTADFQVLLGLRLVAGATGALAFIAGAGLAARAGVDRPASRAAMLVGLYAAGAGLGIVVSGLAIPPLLDRFAPAEGWRAGWLALGVVALLVLAPAAVASRNTSADPPAASGSSAKAWPGRQLVPTVVSYTLFGAGYIAYATFIIALLRAEHLTGAEISVFWAVLGSATIGAAFCWVSVLARASGGQALALLLTVLALGATVPLMVSGPIGAVASGALFGSAVLSTFTAATAIAQRHLPPPRWGPAIGFLTVAFAVGQCVGPVLAGYLSDHANGVRAGLLLSAALLALGAVCALAQRAPQRAQSAGPELEVDPRSGPLSRCPRPGPRPH